jgi:PAS domain S-box-containing protein
MTTVIETKAQRRSIAYIVFFVALFLGYVLLRGSTWLGSTELHTIMEVIATVLALTVGVMALARFYSRKDSVFLFVGSGFLGTAFLDGYHAVVTSSWFADRFPSPPASLIPWSWIASRLFLSILLWVSWLAWRREDRLGKSGKISEQTVYVAVAAFTLISFFFFALVPLPRAYYPEIIFHRPEEFVPAFFFLLALIGYLRKGHWKSDDFEHWLVLALIVGFMGQAMFMSFSGQLFDMMFDAAHLLKKVSYIFVLTGLVISMYYLFRQAEESTEELAQQAAELRDSETYMRSVLDNVLEGIITINERGVIDSFNLAAERIFGYTSTDMIGQHVKTLIPELMAELYHGEHMAREVTAKRKDGTIFPLELGVSEMHLAGESRFISVVRDITERKQAEEEIQKRGRELEARTRELEASQRVTFAASERTSPDELLNLVVNLIRDQFDLYHAQVYLVDEEQGAAVLRESTGYAGRQLLQQKHHIPLDRPALVTKAIREGQPVLVADVNQAEDWLPNPLLPDTQSELVVPLKVGEKVIGALDAQDRAAGRFSERTVALFQTMTDQVTFLFENSELVERITEQTQALTVFTNQLRTAADIARQLGTILDPERLLQQVVEMLQSRFGLYHAHIYVLDEETGELTVQAGSGEVGRVLRERGHSISLDMEKSLVARAAREQGPVVVEDTTLESDFMPNPLLPQTRSEMAVPLVTGDRVLGVLDVQDDRPNRFTETDVDTYSTLAGQIATALENARLFEEQQRTEQALQKSVEEVQQTAEQLREVDRLKSEFMSSMSHELRTPLNSILGYTEVMLMGIDGELPSETMEDIQAIHENGQHLLNLINDILDLAKIEAGTMTLNLEVVEIAPLLKGVKINNAGLLLNKPIEMVVEVEEDLPTIQADEVRLNQILNNLVGNAVKFTDEGTITLNAFRDDSWLCIDVTDTGIGISDEDMKKIFDRFTQADSSDARRAQGTGLGLAITLHLVQMHGGTIDVQSKPGEGSTFTVRLPIDSD